MYRLLFTVSLIAATVFPAIRASGAVPLSAQSAYVEVVPQTSVPLTGAPKFIVNFVAAGIAQSGVPCFDCVKGAQTAGNIGLTAPFNYIATAETAQYSLSLSDITNTASCTLAWSIAAGAKVLDKFSYDLKTPKAGSTYIVGLNRGRPAYSGAAVLTGKVTCTGQTAQTVTASLYFE